MEAVAGIALAGNGLQFASFAYKLVRTGGAIKRSHDGSLKEDNELGVVISNLNVHIQRLHATPDPELQPLIVECKSVALELKTTLQKVRNKPGKKVWSSYAQALRRIWSESKLKDTECRVVRLRDQIEFHMRNIDRQTMTTIAEHAASGDLNAQKAVQALEALHESQSLSFRHIESKLDQLETSISNPARKGANTEQAVTFLDTLELPGHDLREDSVSAAHARTFDWLLADAESSTSVKQGPEVRAERDDLRQTIGEGLRQAGVSTKEIESILPGKATEIHPGCPLQQWLRSGSNVFWIKGKPGCGKSTLMKALLQKKRLKTPMMKLLTEWANGRDLLFAKFFFYRPGIDVQKSLLGFLHSVLYQLLSKEPSLTALAFSANSQRRAITQKERLAGEDGSVWTVPELQAALKKALENSNSCIFFHVDGIDEIECSPGQMVQTLLDISREPHVKILVAGRWTPEFDEAFESKQTLNLHLTTELDVLHYTFDKINQHNWRELRLTPQQFSIILKELISAAEGVFLWVSLVLEALAKGLRNYETFDTLLTHIRSYPRGLDKLYQFLFDSIEPDYASAAAFWLLTVSKSVGQKRQPGSAEFTLYGLARAELFDLHDVNSMCQIRDLGKPHMVAKLMLKKMEAQCRHFFSFTSATWSSKAPRFSHRTVLDFLEQPNARTKLQQLWSKHWNPVISIAASNFVELITSEIEESLHKNGDLADLIAIEMLQARVTRANRLLANCASEERQLFWEQVPLLIQQGTAGLVPQEVPDNKSRWAANTMIEVNTVYERLGNLPLPFLQLLLLGDEAEAELPNCFPEGFGNRQIKSEFATMMIRTSRCVKGCLAWKIMQNFLDSDPEIFSIFWPRLIKGIKEDVTFCSEDRNREGRPFFTPFIANFDWVYLVVDSQVQSKSLSITDSCNFDIKQARATTLALLDQLRVGYDSGTDDLLARYHVPAYFSTLISAIQDLGKACELDLSVTQENADDASKIPRDG